MDLQTLLFRFKMPNFTAILQIKDQFSIFLEQDQLDP